MTQRDLITTHKSSPKNPTIAKVFYKVGYIESWGKGIRKMFDACKKHGINEPIYTAHSNDLKLTFTGLFSLKEYEEEKKNEQLLIGTHSSNVGTHNAENGTHSSNVGTHNTENGTHKLSKSNTDFILYENEMISVIKENSTINIDSIEKQIGVSKRTT